MCKKNGIQFTSCQNHLEAAGFTYCVCILYTCIDNIHISIYKVMGFSGQRKGLILKVIIYVRITNDMPITHIHAHVVYHIVDID